MSLRKPSVVLLGDVHLAPYGAAGALRGVGSSARLEITHEETELRQQNYGRDGGTLALVNRLVSVGINLALDTFSRENLALATRGLASQKAAGSVAAETFVGYRGAFVPFANIGITNVVVKNQAGSTTYINNTDYVVTGTGIYIPPTSAIVEASNNQVAYNYPIQDTVEGLLAGSNFFTLWFDGVNEAEGNTPVRLKANKVVFPRAQSLNLIADEFGQIVLEGEALLDDTVVGSTLSKFYSMSMLSATGS